MERGAKSWEPEKGRAGESEKGRDGDGLAVRSQDKSVRSLPVKCRLKTGQIIVEQSVCGIVFSFPAAVWPAEEWRQRFWVERLTPWWDMGTPDWTPQAHRLRESCVKAINTLMRPAPKTANRWQTGQSLPPFADSPPRRFSVSPAPPDSLTH